jgi:hypothetical protein
MSLVEKDMIYKFGIGCLDVDLFKFVDDFVIYIIITMVVRMTFRN